MISDTTANRSYSENRYKVWFFGGAETGDNKFNVFTGSFIRLMKEILHEDFEFITGIYYKMPLVNVLFALNNAQRPARTGKYRRIVRAAFNQIVESGLAPNTRLIITSSSSGSIVAAQTACYLAEKNRNNVYFSKPFHLVLGASMVSPESELFKKLLHYQKIGTIGTIIHEEVQDEGDTSFGIGGVTRLQAFTNAFGIIAPFLTRKYKGPSFLNTDPEKGHIHRRRSFTVQKALDYIEIIMIRHRLAGNDYMQRALEIVEKEKSRMAPGHPQESDGHPLKGV
jgi:hypothetical protein